LEALKMSQKKLWLLVVRTAGEDVLFAHAEDARNVACYAADAFAEYGERNVEAVEIIPANAAEVVRLARQMRVRTEGRPSKKAA
jgi:hypothetical protein